MLSRFSVAALAILLMACTSDGGSQSPAQHSAAASGPPSPSAAAIGTLPGEGEEFFPGTYTAQFQPSFTIVIGGAVELDCAPGYRCRAEVNVNIPGWLGLDFGHDHGAELNFARLDKVYDPASPGSLIDPPADLGSMIAGLPGFTVVEAPVAATVGGLAGVQVTVQTADQAVQVGTNPDVNTEVGPNSKVAYVVVEVDGQWVLISMGVDPDNITGDFDAAVDALRPMIDTIEWQ